MSWHAALDWLEGSLLGQTLRDAGVWTYAVINLAHILGIATLFGSVLLLDLRLLGWRRNISLRDVLIVSQPLAAAGLGTALASGVCLLAINATDYAANPFLLIKFAAIALGLLNVLILARLPAWQAVGVREHSARERKQLAAVGAVSLLCWLAAVGAGRMIGYW